MDTVVSHQGLDSLTFSPPPIDGTLSIPELCDYNGLNSPNHPAFGFYEDHTRRVVTWSRLSRAINAAASAILQQVGSHPTTVVPILANADHLTYTTLLLGILRAGHHAFPISTRHSPAGVAHLLLQTRAKHLVVGHDSQSRQLAVSALASPALGSVVGDHITAFNLPSFEFLYGDIDSQFEPPTPPPLPVIHPRPADLALIVHSSGTTAAFPKVTRVTHKALLQWGKHPYYGEIDLCKHTMSIHSLTMTHGLGLSAIVWAICTGMSLSGFSPKTWVPVPDPEAVLRAAVEANCSIMFCVPSLLEGWAATQQGIDGLKQIAFVAFGGAPLREATGNLLTNVGVRLIMLYGSIEIGCPTVFIPSSLDSACWSYFMFSSDCKPKLIPQAGNVYHLLFTECDTHTPSITNAESNGVKYYDTNDLIMPHPSNPSLWKVLGRTDDLILHSNGQKTNPHPIEETISRHSMINQCLVFGKGRLFAGVIIECVAEFTVEFDKPHLREHLMDSIWTAVEESNKTCPWYSRIARDMVLVADPARPFKLTAKMTVERENGLSDYEHAIDQLYRSANASSPTTPVDGAVLRGVPQHIDALQLARLAVEKYFPCRVGDDDDLFQAGCDSIQALWIRNGICNVLHHNLRISTRNIPSNIVYKNPTIQKLCFYISQVMAHGQTAVSLSTASGRVSEMEAMLKKYTANLPPPSIRNHTENRKEVVLLTGSTGSLGCYLLADLITDPSIDRVYALNRTDIKGLRSVYIRQASAFKERDLDYSVLNSDKLQLLEADLGMEYFGLEEEDVYEMMRREVTCIIHTAWPTDLITTLPSLEPLVAGTRRLVDFALSARFSPQLMLISSLSIFSNVPTGHIAKEAPIERPSTALGLGYTESKWVTEMLLVKAAEVSGLRTSTIRLPQLSGGPNGAWNPREWFPSIIRGAHIVGCVPNPPGVLSWVAVHDAAKVILELRHTKEPFIHLTNPHPIRAADIFGAIADNLQLPLVPYSEWLMAVDAAHRSRGSDSVACMVLVDFCRAAYRPHSPSADFGEAFGFTSADCSRAAVAAPSRGDIAQLGPRDIETWLNYWRRNSVIRQ